MDSGTPEWCALANQLIPFVPLRHQIFLVFEIVLCCVVMMKLSFRLIAVLGFGFNAVLSVDILWLPTLNNILTLPWTREASRTSTDTALCATGMRFVMFCFAFVCFPAILCFNFHSLRA
jgi:hypothetical protein